MPCRVQRFTPFIAVQVLSATIMPGESPLLMGITARTPGIVRDLVAVPNAVAPAEIWCKTRAAWQIPEYIRLRRRFESRQPFEFETWFGQG
jgi:hypothetical protein